MNKQTAEKLLAQCEKLARVLNEMSQESMSIDDEAIRYEYRKGLGDIIGRADTNLRKFITDRFPELNIAP